jgi:RNA methyltransferase, TrmH family
VAVRTAPRGTIVKLDDVITSGRNPALVAARKLARGPARARAGRFLVEGAQGLSEALAAGARPLSVFATPEAAQAHRELLAQASAAGAELRVVTDRLLAGLAQTLAPQGLVAVVGSVVRTIDEADGPDGADAALPPSPRMVCVLVGVSDPGNAGTVLRAADAFGADALATTAGSVDLESPKAVRASAGSLFHLPVIAGVAWPRLAGVLRDRGLLLIGADPHADATIDQVPLERPCALVLGNEAHGLPDQVRGDLHHLARLPQYGRAESLNLAAAAAVLLYACARRQRLVTGGQR